MSRKLLLVMGALLVGGWTVVQRAPAAQETVDPETLAPAQAASRAICDSGYLDYTICLHRHIANRAVWDTTGTVPVGTLQMVNGHWVFHRKLSGAQNGPGQWVFKIAPDSGFVVFTLQERQANRTPAQIRIPAQSVLMAEAEPSDYGPIMNALGGGL